MKFEKRVNAYIKQTVFDNKLIQKLRLLCILEVLGKVSIKTAFFYSLNPSKNSHLLCSFRPYECFEYMQIKYFLAITLFHGCIDFVD